MLAPEGQQPGQAEASSQEETKIVTRDVVNTDLHGPFKMQEIIDKETGRYWVRVLLSQADVDKWTLQRLQSEQLLKKLIIESSMKTVRDELQVAIDKVGEKKKEQDEKINSIVKP